MNSNIISLLLLFLSAIISFSCQSTQTQSGIQKQFKNIDVNNDELRLRLNEFAVRFSGEVVSAADEIKGNTNDIEIKQNTLLWKMNSIPAANKVIFTIDPFAALIDILAFSRQMKFYFLSGNGKDLFGTHQILAIDASQRLEDEAFEIIRSGAMDEDSIIAKEIIYEWVDANPFKNLTFSRNSTIDFLAKYMADRDRSISASVGSMEASISELSMRLNIYYDQLPKIASWNIEYLANQAMLNENVDSLKNQIERVTTSFEKLANLSDSSKTIIDSTLNVSFQYLDEMRIQTIKDLRNERDLLTTFVQDERDIVLEEINRERIETLEEIENFVNSKIDEVSVKIEDTVDLVFIRALELLAIIYIVLMITIIVFRKIYKKNN